MADEDDGFNEETFKGLEDASKVAVPTPDDPATPPVTPPVEPPKQEPKPADEPKKEEPPKPPEETPPATADNKKPEEEVKPPETPATPPAPVEPATPLTKDDVQEVVSNLLNTERSSSKELDTTTEEVLKSYYPDGLSNTLVDEKSGKELHTPADVVEASGDNMSMDEAAKWLMNEQFKLDNAVKKIRDDARTIAETTVKFKNDGIAVLQKYQPLFDGLKEKYPNLQEKVFQKLMKQVKVDKGAILSAPDVAEYYDDYLEPYQQAFEASTKQLDTPAPATPEPPKPSTDDRMDVSGDGGATPVNDPNDFAQQVVKELAKGI